VITKSTLNPAEHRENRRAQAERTQNPELEAVSEPAGETPRPERTGFGPMPQPKQSGDRRQETERQRDSYGHQHLAERNRVVR